MGNQSLQGLRPTSSNRHSSEPVTKEEEREEEATVESSNNDNTTTTTTTSTQNSRKRDYETMQDSQSSSDTMESIQQDLQRVEQTLEAQQHTNNSIYRSADVAAIDNNSNNSSNSMPSPNPGRALFDSLGSALTSLRGRLGQLGSSSPALSERLQLAERAHATRMPLNMLRRETSTSALPTTDTTAAAAATTTTTTSDDDDASNTAEPSQHNHKKRRPSLLLASRKALDRQQVHQMPPKTGLMRSISEPISLEPTEQSQLLEEEEERRPSLLLPKASIQKIMESPTKYQGNLLLSSHSMEECLNYDGKDKNDEEQPVPEESQTTYYSWGFPNTNFNLFGISGPQATDSPQAIPSDTRIGRSDIVSVALGDKHAVLATSAGSVLICGDNAEGAVNPSRRTLDEDQSDSTSPSTTWMRPMHLESLAMSRVIQVSCGLDHTAVLTDARSVLTFGSNADGQLGHRPKSGSFHFQTPAAMVLPRRAAQVVCGHRFTLVLTTRMEVYVCGREELTGYSTEDGPPRLPEQNPALEGLPLVYIAAGHHHAVVLTSHGTAYAWGSNPTGACGRGFPTSFCVPVPIQVPTTNQTVPNESSPKPFTNWAAWEASSPTLTLADDVSIADVACGCDSTILVTQKGDLLVAGTNTHGQLGVPSSGSVVPVQRVSHPVQGHSFVAAQAGSEHTGRAAQRGLQFDVARREFLFQPYFVLKVDRQYMLQQTLQAVASASNAELRKSLKVIFKGEDGVDAGGVTKEFFQLLLVQLFDVNTGMWSSNFGDGLNTWFNSDCTWNQDGYYLVGVLVAMAFYNGVLLDVHFPEAVYRKLLSVPLGLEDVVDPEVRHGLQSLLDYEGDDVEDVFCLTFEITWNSLGMDRRKELKPGGAKIPVTNENREEYVMLYVKWLLVDSIELQYYEFERGFMQVMEGSSLDMLRPEVLELLVVGSPELDFLALEANTEYEGGFTKDSAVVKNLWKFIRESPRETQVHFLKFATGSNKAPIGGLGALPFKVQRAGPDSMQLPTAHTCFNTLLVPDYGDSYEKLSERLGRAIVECEGFGLQ